MKLDAKMIKELIKEATGPSMLLEEPVLAESSFNQNVILMVGRTGTKQAVQQCD